MKRKLGWFGLGFAGAELAAAILPSLVCVPAAAFLVCLALLWIKRRRDSAIPVLGALCGLAWFLVFTLVWVRPVKALAGQTVTCTAVVETDADASYSESRLRGTLRLTEIDGRAANVKVQCASFPGESAGERFTAKFALTELPDNKYRLSRNIYEITDAELRCAMPLGVSNSFTGAAATVRVTDGTVYVLWQGGALPDRLEVRHGAD